MKTLRLYRHSLKGPDKLLTPEGHRLAIQAGRECNTRIRWGAHGPVLRTAQTAHSFFSGHLGNGQKFPVFPIMMPDVFVNLGSEELFAEMINDRFKQGIAEGLSNFSALLFAHGGEQCERWATAALLDVRNILFATPEGENVAGFFHSPTVELVVWALLELCEPAEMPRDVLDLPEMAGILILKKEAGEMWFNGVIPAPTLD